MSLPHPIFEGRDERGRILPGHNKYVATVPEEMCRLRAELLSLTTAEDVQKMHGKLMELVQHDRPEIACHALKIAMEFLVGRPASVHHVDRQTTEIKVEVSTDEMKRRLQQIGLLPRPVDL